MGEDFAFEYQVCLILHNFAIYSMILIPFLDIAAVLSSLRFTRPPRTGDDGVEDGRRLCG